jgi:hypothetical protein
VAVWLDHDHDPDSDAGKRGAVYPPLPLLARIRFGAIGASFAVAVSWPIAGAVVPRHADRSWG